MSEPKFEYGPFTFCAQNGGKGHCFNAQVFGPDGDSVAIIESMANESEATGLAKLFAAAPDLYEACKIACKFLENLCGVENGELCGYGNDYERAVYSTLLQSMALARGEQ